MGFIKDGDMVHVPADLADHVICDFTDRIAGKTAYAVEVDEQNGEAFVVRDPADSEGTFVPLDLLVPAK